MLKGWGETKGNIGMVQKACFASVFNKDEDLVETIGSVPHGNKDMVLDINTSEVEAKLRSLTVTKPEDLGNLLSRILEEVTHK